MRIEYLLRLHRCQLLERLLLGSPTRTHLKSLCDALAHWPEELDLDSLTSQLHAFLAGKQLTCIKDAKAVFQGLRRDARALLPQVKELLSKLT